MLTRPSRRLWPGHLPPGRTISCLPPLNPHTQPPPGTFPNCRSELPPRAAHKSLPGPPGRVASFPDCTPAHPRGPAWDPSPPAGRPVGISHSFGVRDSCGAGVCPAWPQDLARNDDQAAHFHQIPEPVSEGCKGHILRHLPGGETGAELINNPTKAVQSSELVHSWKLRQLGCEVQRV